jgi:fucose 4-O-acetylase-like acetyltransferase
MIGIFSVLNLVDKKVNEFTYDEFVKHMNNNEIKEIYVFNFIRTISKEIAYWGRKTLNIYLFHYFIISLFHYDINFLPNLIQVIINIFYLFLSALLKFSHLQNTASASVFCPSHPAQNNRPAVCSESKDYFFILS